MTTAQEMPSEKATAAALEEVESHTKGGLAEPVQDEAWLEAERSLTRKLDLTLVPMVWVLYLFNYLDRNNIAQAKLNSFEEDLGLVGNQFNVAVSILNVGYMLMQLPSNMLLTRTRPSIYIPVWVALWSVISACTALADNYGQLIAIRFFLGIAEAPFFPGAMYLLSCWYPRRQLARRTAVLYSGLILATAFSGLIAAGVFEGLEGAKGLAGWQWLFIIEGAASFLFAIVAVAVLPDFPGQRSGVCRWMLTELEHRVAVERMQLDRVSSQSPAAAEQAEGSAWAGLKLACADPKTWVFVLMLLANHSAYGFNNFFPTIVEGMFASMSTTMHLVLTAPPYLLAAVVAFAVATSSDKRKERGFHISIPQGVACVGFIISAATLSGPARYAAAFLYVPGCFASNALVFSWAANSLSQTPEKRACATAIINVLSQLGNIYSPYFFPDSDAPRYLMAMLLMMAFSAMSVATATTMKIMLTKANKKLLEMGEHVTLFMR